MPRNNYHAKLLPNQVYHIYNHSVGKENLFKQPRNYAYFWQQWNKFITPYFANYAFCLMPNHFHVLCKAKNITSNIREKIELEATKKAIGFLNEEEPINVFYESQFRRFFNGYTNAINKQEDKRYGSLFNPDSYREKFRRTLISTREDFMYFVQYIHHNPIHHQFVLNYEDWESSSYTAYSEGVEIEGLSIDPVLRLFDKVQPSNGGFLQAHKDFKENFNKYYRKDLS